MTRDDAVKLCEVFERVDSKCRSCATEVCADASQMKFGFRWFVEKDPHSAYANAWRVSFEADSEVGHAVQK